jgi:alkylhydroperoxidase family enzyme
MARIAPLSIAEAPALARAELERQVAAHGRVTNMKCTLAHSPAALAALMQWYGLYDVVSPVLGLRATTLFVHAISAETNCLVCSTFFRRWLVEQGEDPDALVLDDRERALVEYGRQLAIDAHGVSDQLFVRLAGWLTAEQLVALTAFGGMMIATNVFNNALQVDLDGYLAPFRKSPAVAAALKAGNAGP